MSDPISPIVAGAAIGAGGGILQSAGGIINGLFQRRWAEKQTERQWARDDNAVQRRTADLEAAGLNPILAAGSSAGNSAPMKAEFPDPNMGAPVEGAMEGARTAVNIAQTEAQTELVRQQGRIAKADADLKTGSFKETGTDNVWTWPMIQVQKMVGEARASHYAGLVADAMQQANVPTLKGKVEEASLRFSLAHIEEFRSIELRLKQAGLDQATIKTRMMETAEKMLEVDRKWQNPQRWIGTASTLIGAASGGARAVTGSMLDYAKFMAPSEY